MKGNQDELFSRLFTVYLYKTIPNYANRIGHTANNMMLIQYIHQTFSTNWKKKKWNSQKANNRGRTFLKWKKKKEQNKIAKTISQSSKNYAVKIHNSELDRTKNGNCRQNP